MEDWGKGEKEGKTKKRKENRSKGCGRCGCSSEMVVLSKAFMPFHAVKHDYEGRLEYQCPGIVDLHLQIGGNDE